MLVIGIAGGSGSGKTTFTKKILARTQQSFGADDQSAVAVLHLDSYYLSPPPTQLKSKGGLNFDHPDAFDWKLLLSHLKRSKKGLSIQVPIYDYKSNKRTGETTIIEPPQTLLLEGIHVLWNPDLRNLLDIKVYLHVDADIRFIRRLHRDVRERGRTLDGIIRQYYDTVRPMHHKFLEPTQQFADIVVGEETDIAADILASRIIQVLSK